VCVYKGAADTVAIQFDYPNAKYVEKSSASNIYKGLANGECKVALEHYDPNEKYINLVDYNPGCELIVYGVPVLSRSSSFSVKSSAERCSSIIRDVLDIFILEMKDDGTLTKIKQDYNKGDQDCNLMTEGKSEESFSLSFLDMAGIFIMHYGILVLTLILGILQVKCPLVFASSAQELPIVRRLSILSRNVASHLFTTNEDDEHQIKDQIKASAHEGKGASDACSNIATPPNNELIKELHSEVIKLRNDVSEIKMSSQKMAKSLTLVQNSLACAQTPQTEPEKRAS